MLIYDIIYKGSDIIKNILSRSNRKNDENKLRDNI